MKSPKTPASKFNLRLPPEIREAAEAQADSMGMSLNAYCIQALQNFIPYTAKRPRLPARPTSHTPAARSTTPTARKITAPTWAKVGRNDPCPCGSGRKAKHCHPEAC
ncbi:SEC-C metal-binding domain-containing protein [Lysobacter sp. CA199]|uniref:SEC-C metal-binding domain-containing protein n=1 Tax=Lysobacter sp. CA199 TaxID=3455608 RepID=UPI003F8D613C